MEERTIKIKDRILGKYNDIREMLYVLTIENKPTLVIATGGSIESEYSSVSIFNTSNLEGNIFWKEYYLIIQI